MSSDRIMAALRAPYVSEKATRLSEHNQYVFSIAPEATKADVKAAVEKLFAVSVIAVNIASIKGKLRSFRSHTGRRAGNRKAYVRLAEGQSIDVAAGKA